MLELSDVSLVWIIAGFLASAAVIAVAGTLLAGRADVLADRTGWGEALVGAVLLGGSTSLPGILTSVSTAWQGFPSLSIANAIGGIAVQTAFLAVADLFYRRANLEHAAASAANLTQGSLLVTLLAVPVAAAAGPDWTLLGVHPGTLILLGGYAYGIHLVRLAKEEPMWFPRMTRETQNLDEEAKASEEEPDQEPISKLWIQFGLLVACVAAAGLGISQTGIAIAERTGIAQTAVGGLMTAVATSLPELVTSVAAVRRGALTLAVSGIIGGNAFDTIFLAFSDVAYRDGSLYHQMNDADLFVISATIVMIGVLLMGLLRREKTGPGGIGFESATILVLYAVASVIMAQA
ncbi:sodium:calcium antiporter [Salinarimonas ramus]|uniref:Cation transporter n=1 Tax=Salinarimonas ramus TaxID=690164 RepID=A0A917QF78_9HYPH|nr:sodium:calcium antiporter [Salinarimonas ramus]GGK47832.1 cation transporter [Salinarimonas ramus]